MTRDKETDTMGRKRINKLLLCLLTVVLSFSLIGTTYAYYTNTTTFYNPLITSNSAVHMTELFNQEDLWLPGETKEKEVWFGNHYHMDQVLRFKVDTLWLDNKGTPTNYADDEPWTYTGTYTPDPAVINWTSEITGVGGPATWTKIGDYYYYNMILEAQSGTDPTETRPVMKSVTFSPDISNDGVHSEDFSNKVCRITITMEAVDVNPDVTLSAWGVSFTRVGGINLTWP